MIGNRPLRLIGLLLPSLCAAETGMGPHRIEARLAFGVQVPPVFKVLQTTSAQDGLHHRVWTNMKSIVIDGREYRFSRAGEAMVVVPSPTRDTIIIHGL